MLLTPGVNAVIRSDAGLVLAMRSAENGAWYMIGGAVDPGEELGDALVREVYEEAGIHVRVERLVAVNSEPLITYPNGDRMNYMCFCFLCTPLTDDLRALDGEADDLRWFEPADLMPLLTQQDQYHLSQALSGEQRAHFFYDELPPYLPYVPAEITVSEGA